MERELSFPIFLGILLRLIANENGRGKTIFIEHAPEKLHPVFRGLKRKYGMFFPPLKKLHFHEAGAFSYSQELNEAIDMLLMSGKIDYLHSSRGNAYAVKPYANSLIAEEEGRIIVFDAANRAQYKKEKHFRLHYLPHYLRKMIQELKVIIIPNPLEN